MSRILERPTDGKMPANGRPEHRRKSRRGSFFIDRPKHDLELMPHRPIGLERERPEAALEKLGRAVDREPQELGLNAPISLPLDSNRDPTPFGVFPGSY